MAKRGLGRVATSPALSVIRPTVKAPAASTQRVLSFRVPDDLNDRFLNAVDALSGPPERLTYVSLGRAAIEREVERLEKKHNSGKPFPQRPSK